MLLCLAATCDGTMLHEKRRPAAGVEGKRIPIPIPIPTTRNPSDLGIHRSTILTTILATSLLCHLRSLNPKSFFKLQSTITLSPVARYPTVASSLAFHLSPTAVSTNTPTTPPKSLRRSRGRIHHQPHPLLFPSHQQITSPSPILGPPLLCSQV
jgi:hypothetical protein